MSHETEIIAAPCFFVLQEIFSGLSQKGQKMRKRDRYEEDSDFETRKERRRKLRRRRRRRNVMMFILAVLTVLAGFFVVNKIKESLEEKRLLKERNDSFVGVPPFEVDLLDVNEYSRPGTPLEEIKGIVIHYTANPGTTAKNNRDYFQGLKDSHETKVSSHFVVGYDGEIVQCVPSTEIAYASNSRNEDTLSIECCHLDETGKFTEATYISLVRLTGWLCWRFNLTEEDVIRHYDVTGKICPKYYVENPDAWEQFKADVKVQIQKVDEEVKASKGE